MNAEPEFPRPIIGDELIVVTPADGCHPARTETVQVTAVARYKISVTSEGGYSRVFDLRDRKPWTTPSGRIGRRFEATLHNRATLDHSIRKSAANTYLLSVGVSPWSLRGTLGEAASADPVGYANALRRFEGLDDI